MHHKKPNMITGLGWLANSHTVPPVWLAFIISDNFFTLNFKTLHQTRLAMHHIPNMIIALGWLANNHTPQTQFPLRGSECSISHTLSFRSLNGVWASSYLVLVCVSSSCPPCLILGLFLFCVSPWRRWNKVVFRGFMWRSVPRPATDSRKGAVDR